MTCSKNIDLVYFLSVDFLFRSVVLVLIDRLCRLFRKVRSELAEAVRIGVQFNAPLCMNEKKKVELNRLFKEATVPFISFALLSGMLHCATICLLVQRIDSFTLLGYFGKQVSVLMGEKSQEKKKRFPDFRPDIQCFQASQCNSQLLCSGFVPLTPLIMPNWLPFFFLYSKQRCTPNAEGAVQTCHIFISFSWCLVFLCVPFSLCLSHTKKEGHNEVYTHTHNARSDRN